MLFRSSRRGIAFQLLLIGGGLSLILLLQARRLSPVHRSDFGQITSQDVALTSRPTLTTSTVTDSHRELPLATIPGNAGHDIETSIPSFTVPSDAADADGAGSQQESGGAEPPAEAEPPAGAEAPEGAAESTEAAHNGSSSAPTEVEVAAYVGAVMDPNDESLPRLSCPRSIGTRYRALRTVANSTENGKIQYLFALDLYQVQALLPTLLGSVVQVIRFLGPERCALSVVEGRSTDATYAILEGVREEVERLGATVYLNTSDVDPMGGSKDRMESLAELRNQALAPFVEAAHLSTSDAAVVFLNDVSICAHDILELVYQHRKQQAHMTCGMDWSEQGAIFYDIYVARSLVGETFWQIAQDGLWHFSGNLFWADLEAKSKYERLQPFQVYACWNGGAVIDAAPLLQRQIQFRGSREGECYMGEPTLFCKDLWRLHRGRIQVIPTVNVGYDNEATEKIKDLRGRVEDKIDTAREELQAELVEWQAEPPSLVKCMREFAHPYWVPST